VISAILSFISGLFQVAGKIFDWLYAKRLVDAGRTAQQLESLKEQVNAAQKAVQARLAVERDLAANPDGVRDDDGFRRADDGSDDDGAALL
jgi:hypothetical protein